MTTSPATDTHQKGASGERISGYRTILENNTDYHVKHPLQSRWTLTQKMGQVENASSRGVSTREWEAGLVPNVSIGTVEDFWCLYNGMQDVTTIPVNCDYFFMREGIKPMWEDPANKGGCDFRVVVGRNMDTATMWKMALLAAVGCQFTDHEFVTGVQFALRNSKSRIAVWCAAAPPEVLARIKEQFGLCMEKASGAEGNPIHVEMTEFKKPPASAPRGGDRGRGGGGGGGDRDRPRGGDRRNDDRGGDDRSGWSRSGGGPSGGGGGSGNGSRGGMGRSSFTGGDRDSPREDRRRPF